MIIEGKVVQVPPYSDLYAIAKLFAVVNDRSRQNGDLLKPDMGALRRLVLTCHGRTDLFRGREAHGFANALLAVSAHASDWIRSPEDWKVRSHNNQRQFHSLVRHLVARYDVPAFMNAAWLEGLTARGVVQQRWFIHVAQGQNIRTAPTLPLALTKKQAQHFLRAPDFDVSSAFRWAQIIDLGGSERLVRSVLSTRIATEFHHDEFWLSVFRWLVANPMLDPTHHDPIIDYLYDQRFVASIANPSAHVAGEPRLVAPQPNLTMKGRSPVTLLRAVEEWHRRLGRERSRKAVSWPPSGLPPFQYEEGDDHNQKVYAITELLSSRELEDEGRAMCHCVASYAGSCAAGRTSIWVLKVADAYGRETRLLTIEVWTHSRQIVQARQKFNNESSPKERMILTKWASAGGPSLSRLLAR